ncbi:winged helix-turn-helix domain-containing protein [Kineosporia succinea]|uniref:DNA-binding response OmpR family regulator n=1 Tax=Kineosporia succinea TaxID=84632 RepID=A0ABT9PDY8_9ACTN|nr:winged helix-turn-helix domain-containing protein [Kineosporia succinea]MDP9830914.1 DNA-binding response OmpR family regulator [Kineosporia succinea]
MPALSESALLRALTPRDLAAMTPAVLCAEAGSAAAGIHANVGRGGWPAVRTDDATRAAHTASVRGARLVLVGGSGFGWVAQAVRKIRTAGSFPIAVVATELSDAEAVGLLDSGATVVIEPRAGARELVARLGALGRGAGEEDGQVRWLQAEQMRVDLTARRCLLGPDRIDLSTMEFDLLAFLMSRAQQVVPLAEILQQVWRWHQGDGANTLRLHIGRIRRKLGDTATSPRWIRSVRGIGYEFLPAVAELGEDRSEERLRQSIAVLNAQADALDALVTTIGAAPDVPAIAETVVQWAVARGFADAATIFRMHVGETGESRAVLVASAGMSARWRQSIATGHPIGEGFLGAQVYSSGEVVQLSDMSRLVKRFPVTARMSAAEDLHSCVLLPLQAQGRIWGDLAFVGRTVRAFNPSRTAYLRTVAGVVALGLSARLAHEKEGPRG